ncbi:MAG: amino acid adenylation domain-containing protein [Acidobacteriota bacterium]|nr:amino acid adenylation domain-containing protein [Acidobacteriota bacterium]
MFSMLTGAEGQREDLSFSQLDRRARGIAASLLSRGKRGQRVLLVFQPGLNFISAFFGCIYAGMVAVPVYPPRRGRDERILAVTADCRPSLALTETSLKLRTVEALQGQNIRTVDIAACLTDAALDIPQSPQPEDLAFLQYTSGSTGTPKGVMVTHGNIMANQKTIAEAFETTRDDICLNWLPLYHDMGLIGTVLHPVFMGFDSILMNAAEFLREPVCWLRRIHHYGATLCGAPNFAFDHILRRVRPDQLEGLDLSSWRVAFNGAEPVRAHTIERFSRTLAPYGFRPRVMFPCYGMAEATLFITAGGTRTEPVVQRFAKDALSEGSAVLEDGEKSTALVGCGFTRLDHQVRIVDEKSHVPLPENQVGEIWFSGPSVATGYWGKPELTQASFQARTVDDARTAWLRTGDLGFLHQGELFITGRLKDLLIFQGRNHYPQDIERTAESAHPALRSGHGAAFSVEGPAGDMLVVTQEVERTALRKLNGGEVCRTVTSAIAKDHQLATAAVVLLMPGSLPQTSSGKIRRQTCRQQYLDGGLRTVYTGALQQDAAFAEDMVDELTAVVAKALEMDPSRIAEDEPLTSYGLSSLSAMEIQDFFLRTAGAALSLDTLFEGATLADLRAPAAIKTETVEEAGEQQTPDTVFPLSHHQRTLWYLYQMQPEDTTYNLAFPVTLDPMPNPARLTAALRALLERHPALRTTYGIDSEGVSIQKVGEVTEPLLVIEDATAWSSRDVRDYLQAEASRPFNLEKEVIRAILLKRSERPILMLVIHHIAVDLQSFQVLVRDLACFLADRRPAGPAPGYHAYVTAQRHFLDSAEGRQSGDFWMSRLQHCPTLDMPLDAVRPMRESRRGAEAAFKLDAPLVGKLEAVARKKGSTLFSLLLAAYKTLLYRWSGQTDLVVGFPAADRPPGLGELVGYCVNMLPLRTQLDEHMPFENYWEQVREQVNLSLAHRAFPFAAMVEQLQLERDAGRHPIFQTAFVLQMPNHAKGLGGFALRRQGARMDLEGITAESLALPVQTTPFDMTLTLAPDNGGLTGSWQYATDLFQAETMEHQVTHFQNLLVALVENPGLKPNDLTIMMPSERDRLLASGQSTAAHTVDTTLNRLFEEAVTARPNDVALVHEEASMTMAELDMAANRMAHALQARGVGPEVIVGLCLNRSMEMITAILAVLKAGGVYLPLNPDEPDARLSMVLADAGASLLITRDRNAASFPQYRGHIFDLATFSPDTEPHTPPDCRQHPDQAAYVIYTSGSTGRPKGVVITHTHVIRLFKATDAWFQFSPTDVWTLFHNVFFDFSVWEMWGALLHGGKLVIVPYWTARSPLAFRDLLYREGVTVLNQTPTAFRQLIPAVLEDPHAEEKLCLREIIFGGETLDLPVLAPWIARFGHDRPRLVNMYGITETTVHITLRPIEKQDLDLPRAPIGMPIPDSCLHVLDNRLQLQPEGVVGELCVGGAAPARGYLNRPGLTAQKFVPDPFGKPGSRLYRSGDLGRLLLNGEREHHGRMDHQVKISGYRIELGEIEAAVSAHPDVSHAVILPFTGRTVDRRIAKAPVQGGAAGGMLTPLRGFMRRNTEEQAETEEARLACWLAPAPGKQMPSVDTLRRFLAQRLPPHMIPAFFVSLDALPLTPNGKLDRKALPDPRKARPELGGNYTPPRNDAERTLERIWSKVLGLDRVGVTDDFFDLGGDSIRSIQVRSLAAAKGLNFTLTQMYRAGTIRELALVAGSEAGDEPVPLTEAFSLITAEDKAGIPAGVIDAYPLSRLQAGVIFHGLQQPESPMYREIFFYHLRAPLKPALMQKVLDQLVARHPILRTSFDLTEFSEPMQLVHDHAHVSLPVEDWRSLSPAQQREALPAWIEKEKHRHWDWQKPPLVHFSIHRLTDETFYFVMSFHDAVSDGWSDTVLLTEVLQHYDALLGGRELTLTAPRCGYRDFIALERRVMHSETDRAFWKENLAECTFSAVPRLPSYNPADKTPRVSVCNVAVPRKLSNDLKDLASKCKVGTKHILLTAHMAMLRFLTGQNDVLSGLESNGRLEGLDGDRVLGVHLNIVPFRMILADGSWRDIIAQTYAAEQTAFANRRFPLAELQKGRGGQPLLEINFNYTHFHLFRDLDNMRHIEVLGAEGFGQTHFTMAAEFNQDPFSGDINLDLVGNPAEISEDQLINYGGYYLRFLQAMTADPEAAHHHCLPFDEKERTRILETWNQTQQPYPPNHCIHHMVQNRIEQTPDAQALIFDDRSWTYRELGREAEKIAWRMCKEGLQAGDLVGLCFESSPHMLICILAVLRAGGAWLPLEPSYPAQRLAWMLEDADVAMILTVTKQITVLPPVDVPVLTLDTLELPAPPPAWPLPDFDPGLPAYVLFTSGSTGRPKGVPISHRNLWNCTISRHFYREPVSRFILLCPFSFDLSVGVIFWTIHDGGALVLPREGVRRDIQLVSDLVMRHKVTHWLSVPALYHEMLRHVEPEKLATLKLSVNGGEAPPRDMIDAHFRTLPDTAFVNEYGPTEATIWSTARYCEPVDLDTALSIGHPIDNTQIYMLDRCLRPTAPGVPGHLHIGGDGLSRGYLGRPALTATQFIPNPFTACSGARIYRTGDLARFLADGRIEHLGRLDHQVKIRGFRIELEEIELALKEHPAVADAVTVARASSNGVMQLVGYLTPRDSSEESLRQLEPMALQRFLSRSLSDYMVPRHLILLETMPRTPNGKIDRKSLPEPGRSRSTDTPYVAPETTTQQRIAAIWAEVLDQERVGLYDNFFELGGDSIHCIRVVAKAGKTGLAVTVANLFEHPTVAGLAALIQDADQTEIPMEPVPRDQPLPLSYSQRRLWFLAGMDIDPAVYNIPGSLEIEGDCRIDAMQHSLEDMFARHEILRTVFSEHNGEPVQHIRPQMSPELQVLDLTHLPPDRQQTLTEDLLRDLTARPFDLSTGPLLRVLAVRQATRRFKVLLSMHHIISDAWSAAILLREWVNFYQARLRNEENPLPAGDLQYADYAHWQQRWMMSEEAPRLVDWWQNYMAGAPAFLELPYDRPRPAVRTSRGNMVNFSLDVATRARLEDMAAAHESSPFMVLQALFMTLLHRCGAGDDLVLGTPVANREQHQTQDMLGFFVNTVLLRGRPEPDLSFRDFLVQVRDNTRQSFAHQSLPFDRLVEELKPERSLSYHPVFQVMLVYQNVPLGNPQLPDLKLTPETVRGLPTEFDLVLEVEQVEEGLNAFFRYSEDLFDRTGIEAMSRRFRHLVADALANPQKQLSRLTLLDEESSRRILLEGCGKAVEPTGETGIHHLVPYMRDADPNAPALHDPQAALTWSYRELNSHIEQLAAYLQTRGVGSETPVAVYADHGTVFALAGLAVLRAGGFYVPLDPAQPTERLASMIEDSGARLLLTPEEPVSLPPLHQAEPIFLDQRGLPPATHLPATLKDAPGGDRLAYIMYTSGSTGKPKGVAVSHRAMVNRLLWARDAFPMNAGDRFLHLSSFGFDISLWELAAPLMQGACAVLAPPEARSDMLVLKRLIAEEGITDCHFVPSLLQAFLIEAGADDLPHRIYFGGEALPAALYETLSAFKNVSLYQFYGPTEAAINVTCQHGQAENRRSIGRPVSGARVHCRDAALQVQPVGIPGQICIGGVSLARGYHGQPALTARQFVPDPLSDKPGARLYLTGDKAARLPDGALAFLGRVDNQLKIRGNRIEPGEVEAALLEQPGIEQVVVMGCADRNDDLQLVAWVRGDTTRMESFQDLRSALARRIPPYMIPTRCLQVDHFPVTANHKLDRAALREQFLSEVTENAPKVLPRTPLETQIAATWEDLLGCGPVGIHDNFFNLGGHSLLATKILSRLRKEFKVPLSLRYVFEEPTVAGLAERIEKLQRLADHMSRETAQESDEEEEVLI